MKKTTSLALLGTVLLAAPAHAALTSGLVAYYSFQQSASGDGATVTNDAATVGSDYAGAFTNGTISGATPTSGFSGSAAYNSNAGAATSNRSTLLVGNSANFNHTGTDTIRTGLSSSLLGANYSISMWFYGAVDPDAAAGQRYFLFEDGTNAANFEISSGSAAVAAAGAPTSLAFNNYINSSTAAANNVANSFTTGAWHQGVWVYTNTTTAPSLTLYVDNALIGTIAVTGDLSFTDINIGNARDTIARGWDGMIDEVAIYNRALTASEVGQLNALGVAGQAIPEPSITLLGGFGLLALLRRRRA